MHLFYLSYFFLIGTIFGSFFNVVGLRVPHKNLFESQRSYCPQCHRTIAWYDLLPVVSYMLLGGKCRHCKKKISLIYPTVELFTGAIFALSYYLIGFQIELMTALLLCSLLSIIIVTDLTYMLIPDRILLFFLPLFVLLRVIHPLDPWWSPIIGAVVGFGLLALIIIVSRGGMGGGDMKLFALLGVVLGVEGVLLSFFFSTLYGSVISMLLLSLKVIERKKPIPFGPFIVLGALTTYFYGEQIVQWYLTTFF